MTTSPETVDILHRLRAVCLETERGLRLAAGATGSLAPVFEYYATQRREFADGLSRRIGAFGASAISPRVAPHCYQWPPFRSSVGGRDIPAILAECELGDRAASRIYAEALDAPLRTDIRADLQQQLRVILETMAQIRRLRLGTTQLTQSA